MFSADGDSMRLPVVLALAGWLIIAGCGSDPSEPGADLDYFPISLGNLWDYDVVILPMPKVIRLQ